MPPAPRPRRALVVGRFQPPHRGHLECLRQAADEADELIVVIGSAQRSHTYSDPFTAGERIELLHAAARDTGLTLHHVVPVTDLGQYHLWVAHVDSQVPAYDTVVTGSPLTAHLFQAAGRQVRRIDVQHRDRWSGTTVRGRLYADDEVKDDVTPAVAAWLEQGPIQERLAALAAANVGQNG